MDVKWHMVEHGEAALVECSGELDLLPTMFVETVIDAAATRHHMLVLHLGAVTYLQSAALGAILDIAWELWLRGG